MSLQEQIETTVRDDLWAACKDYQIIGSTRDLITQRVINGLGELPTFAPVAAKEWPDAEGVWSREGKLFLAFKTPHGFGLIDHRGCRTDNGDYAMGSLHGHWLPAHILVPPLAPKPEPKMTVEAWAVVNPHGQIITSYNNKALTESQLSDWGGAPYSIVRIPPQPIEEAT